MYNANKEISISKTMEAVISIEWHINTGCRQDQKKRQNSPVIYSYSRQRKQVSTSTEPKATIAKQLPNRIIVSDPN